MNVGYIFFSIIKNDSIVDDYNVWYDENSKGVTIIRT